MFQCSGAECAHFSPSAHFTGAENSKPEGDGPRFSLTQHHQGMKARIPDFPTAYRLSPGTFLLTVG